MPEKLSVHDNVLYAYSVVCDRRRLVLHTKCPHGDPPEFTDVVFEGVAAHRLCHDLPGNILFDVTEVDVESVVRENAALLADSWRYGWPDVDVDYRGDLDRLVAGLNAGSTRAYEVSASYGLSGWVLAARCERRPRDPPAVDL